MNNQKDDSENKYNHPFIPYKIQIELMNAIYDTLENNYKVGIFESPTGTGKTLSIICSSMTWLRDYKKNNVFSSTNYSDNDSSDDEPEWVKKAYESTILSRSKNKIKDYELYLNNLQRDYELNKQEIYHLDSKSNKKRTKIEGNTFKDDDFLPNDYNSDSEYNEVKEKNSELSKEINNLLNKVNSKDEPIELVNECPIKIYYSSRTHSQLNQFSNQLNLTKFESSFDEVDERIKYLPLGSRKQLCINSKIKNISNNDVNVNDACIDLQKLKEGCEYLPKDNLGLIKKFADLSLTKIHDIEELGKLGSNLKVCPYYSVRKGVELTEIISLPYQMLLQDSTRQILNLGIENSIIIIDEAHNLLDVINSMNSVDIKLDELNLVIKSLKFYLNRFLKRLNSGNRINLMKIIKLCQILISFINKNSKSIKIGSEISIEEIFGNSNGDLFNIYKIEKFLNKSKIAYKIESYMEKFSDTNHKTSSSNPLLFKVTRFLKCLNNPSKEGKFIWDKSNGIISINYMLLDPSEIFKEIVNKSKCVLLCGGTMEPISDYLNYLFPYIPKSNIKTYSCDHIIPNDNLKVFPIKTYNNLHFEFSFDKRNNANMILSLGEIVLKLIEKVPYGLVIFFPSYKYLNNVLRIWKSNEICNRINKLKQIFQEPTDSSKVESVLNDYSNLIKIDKKGAILFSVVGGKMSEGINFSDELARAVVMIGLPFPNAFSGEIIARRKFIESKTIKNGGSEKEAIENSKSFYENICMRSVNQSIGRSIRHINDYSIIYLIDQRYELSRVQNKLSGWVKKRIINNLNIDETLNETEEFFRSKLISKLE